LPISELKQCGQLRETGLAAALLREESIVRLVIALGGNALLQRGQPMTESQQRENVKVAAGQIARIAAGNELVIAHGNGPQVGLLALQSAAYKDVAPYPLDVLGAQTEGMIGYLIEQELGNLLPFEVPFATILTQVEVDPADPAFAHPTKPIGPVYTKEEAQRLADERGWSIAQDGNSYRRVVASPRPQRIFEIRPVKWLLEKGTVVICAGGGGIPTCYGDNRRLRGVEAVIDKDLCSALLAEELDADLLVIATDVNAAYVDWGEPTQMAISYAHPDELETLGFASGSMGPKVQAAIEFARKTGKDAVIGALPDIVAIVNRAAGTRISTREHGMLFYPPA
jgi:carbamate kinase